MFDAAEEGGKGGREEAKGEAYYIRSPSRRVPCSMQMRREREREREREERRLVVP